MVSKSPVNVGDFFPRVLGNRPCPSYLSAVNLGFSNAACNCAINSFLLPLAVCFLTYGSCFFLVVHLAFF